MAAHTLLEETTGVVGRFAADCGKERIQLVITHADKLKSVRNIIFDKKFLLAVLTFRSLERNESSW